MLTFNITNVPAAPSFTPVSINITVDSPADLMLVTNIFGGLPAGTSTQIDALADALRTKCDAAGIAKSARKSGVGYNWGKKLREALARIAELED